MKFITHREMINFYVPQIYDYKFKGNLFLIGSSVKTLSTNKDLDIVVYNGDKEDVLKFINKNNFEYTINNFGEYKIHLHCGISIDLMVTNDLYKLTQYNYDGLFYQFETDLVISFGYNHCVENGTVRLINSDNIHPNQDREFYRLNKIKGEINEN